MQVEEKCCDYKFKDNFIIADKNKDNVLPPALEESIMNIVKNTGYINYKINTKLISTDGGNYLGLLYEIDVKGKTLDGDKEINIFVKNIIPGEELTILSVSEVYSREIFVYKELSRAFTEVQDEAQVPLEDRYKMVKSYDESNLEAIILENLSKKGFKTCYRMDVIPLKFAVLSVQQLAKFHALSFVLEKKRPEYFARKIKTIKPAFTLNEEWENFMTNMCNLTMKYLDGDAKKKLEDQVPNILMKYPEYIFNTTSTVCCMCHGDYRANNVLMKETNGEVTEVIPIDYQLINYGCPILDFLYFIYGATDREFRKNHLEDLKNMYYETLDRFLEYFDMSAECVYPRKRFEKDFKAKRDYGLFVALFMSPFLFVKEGEVPDFGKEALSNISINADDRLGDRMCGLIDEFTELGYL